MIQIFYTKTYSNIRKLQNKGCSYNFETMVAANFWIHFFVIDWSVVGIFKLHFQRFWFMLYSSNIIDIQNKHRVNGYKLTLLLHYQTISEKDNLDMECMCHKNLLSTLYHICFVYYLLFLNSEFMVFLWNVFSWIRTLC